MSELNARTNESNPDPRIAVALLLDISGSMSGAPIIALNEGFQQFVNEISDPGDLASKRAEITVITFDSVARQVIPFTEGRDLRARQFSAGGTTAMGAAIDLAMAELESQKRAYKGAGIDYYRPWLFIITDGGPTDGPVFDQAAERVRSAERAKGLSVFSVLVGPGGDMSTMSRLSASRTPLRLQGLRFNELFSWLSASMSAVSDSNQHGSDDDEAAANIALPSPMGWATT
ncbi:MAG: vWA domain-containing protein [Candidatus Nanopelagicales bacterium]